METTQFGVDTNPSKFIQSTIKTLVTYIQYRDGITLEEAVNAYAAAELRSYMPIGMQIGSFMNAAGEHPGEIPESLFMTILELMEPASKRLMDYLNIRQELRNTLFLDLPTAMAADWAAQLNGTNVKIS